MKIFNEKGEEVKLGDVIQSISPEIINNIIIDLDEYARDYDRYEFGLPLDDTNINGMTQCIINILNTKK